MNILFVNWAWYPTGGDWTFISIVKKKYEQNGHKVIPFSVNNKRNEKNNYSQFFIEGIDYKEINRNKSIKNSLKVISQSVYSFEAKRKLRLLLKENKIDVAQFVSINNSLTPSIISVLKEFNIPIVWRLVDYKLICPNTTFMSGGEICESCKTNKYYKCVIKKCKKDSISASLVASFESYFYSLHSAYKNIDKYSFQSNFTRDKFVEFGFPLDKSFILANPIEYEEIEPNYDNHGYILYFGRLEKYKGIFTMLEAMKKLPNVKLKIVGMGEEQDACQKMVELEGLKNVSFLGAKWGIELDDVLNKSAFVVIPSEWYEPSPYVILQSFAAGKPVIGSRIGGIQDLIIDGYNGLMFEVSNSESLAEKVSLLYGNDDLTKKYGRNARTTVEENHKPEVYYEKTIEIFEGLLKK